MNLSRALACAVLAACATPVQAAITDLDTSFNGDGIATINAGYDSEVPNDIFVAPSGLIYVLGRARNSLNGGYDQDRIIVMRLKASGALDSSFGSGGKFIIPESKILENSFVPYGMLVDEAGKRIYFAGAHIGVMNGNSSRIAVARTTFAGVYDPSFGDEGVAYIDAPSTNETYAYDNIGSDLALLDDGSVVVIGARLKFSPSGAQVQAARFSSTGVPDTTFGGADSYNGLVTLAFGQSKEYAWGLQPTPDGALAFIGATGNDDYTRQLVVGRITAAGEFDTTFSTDGWLADDLGGNLFSALSPRVTPDGMIAATGWYIDGNGADRNFIVRYTDTGDRDTTFGTGGLYDEPIDFYVLNGTLALHPSGRIMSTYETYSESTKYDFRVVKLMGHSALAVPGYVEPSGGGGGSGALGGSGLALLLLAALRVRRTRPRASSRGV
jgi:uncharacterized delta-60 repeat protein